ncbi:hypothetical protein H6G17_00580 [Chroococcidiopsis sp. FACHB-1243]|uniref:hypothetical protein n=1 Tax=Chroococcidiopsis sp. [FACHB-1243] TaxID=2692781 RepID=UPI00177B8F6C|nr:hypothetical protein [Chroococcidiopsis sp. [FACHB-1243]]MBD2304017.1 hypothetical protein [Chroococcidiopsis sp. [FACHB-1243]]
MNELELSLRSGRLTGRSRRRAAKTSNSIHLTRDNPEYFFQIYLEGVRGIQNLEV